MPERSQKDRINLAIQQTLMVAAAVAGAATGWQFVAGLAAFSVLAVLVDGLAAK